MSQARDRKAGLATLLGDVLSAGQPEPELLVRYAESPDSLSPEERQSVEMHLAQSPAYADQLKVLKNFDFSVLEEEARAVVGASWMERFRERLAAVGRFFEISPAVAWVPVAAAAALMMFLLYPAVFQRGDRGPGPVAQLPVSPAPPEEIVVAQEPATAEPAPEETKPAQEETPIMLAQGEKEVQPPPGRASPAPPTAEPKPAPKRPAPIVLAMAIPSYRAPAGAPPRLRASGSLRGDGTHVALVAGVPEHVARTASEQPSLFWYLSELPPRGSDLEFAITDEDSSDPLYQTPLPLPSEPGLQRIDLADFGVKLPPTVEYRWSVALRTDPSHPSRDVVAQGWIQRVGAPAPVAAMLDEAGPTDVPIVYAESGYWYEAFSTLSDLIELYPENESLRLARRELLKQAGLQPIAETLE